MSHELYFFLGFLLFVFIMLAVDLGVFNKQEQEVSLRQAGLMSIIWVSFAVGFYFLLLAYGDQLHNIRSFHDLEEIIAKYRQPIRLVPGNFEASIGRYKQNLSLEFITGYLVEYALSVDNIFVMVLIFNSFKVEKRYYHRVLFWGILGAVFMRFVFIFLGATLISRFTWILYLFGLFLVYTGVMMLFQKEEDDKIDPEQHKMVRLASRFFSIYPEFVGKKFFVRREGKRMLTPLFLVLLIVEFTDLIFAVDSIPAIFAVTKDPYIVFFSNIFAILGLRSMFFLLANIIHKFKYLKTGLAVLLVFVGGKMLAHDWLDKIGFSNVHSLLIIVAILAISVSASLIFARKKEEA